MSTPIASLALPDVEELPIVVVLTGNEIASMAAQHYTPNQFNQYLLEKLRAKGGPVEGIINLKLTHGKLAAIKPRLEDAHLNVFKYLWLPSEHAAMLSKFIAQEIDMAKWRERHDAGCSK